VNLMKRDEEEDVLDVVTATFFIHSDPVTMLFNFGASHSFVRPGIADKLKLVPSLRSLHCLSLCLRGDTYRCGKLFRGYPILKAG